VRFRLGLKNARTFQLCFRPTSARLPIRTLASGYALAAVLRNTSSVSSSDIDGYPKYITSVAHFSATVLRILIYQHHVLPRTRKTIRLISVALYSTAIFHSVPKGVWDEFNEAIWGCFRGYLPYVPLLCQKVRLATT